MRLTALAEPTRTNIRVCREMLADSTFTSMIRGRACASIVLTSHIADLAETRSNDTQAWYDDERVDGVFDLAQHTLSLYREHVETNVAGRSFATNMFAITVDFVYYAAMLMSPDPRVVDAFCSHRASHGMAECDSRTFVKCMNILNNRASVSAHASFALAM